MNVGNGASVRVGEGVGSADHRRCSSALHMLLLVERKSERGRVTEQ